MELRRSVSGLTWKLDPETFGVAALCAGDAFAAWSANNPSLMTTRTFRTKGGVDAKNVANDIILGGLAGTGVALLVGLGGSLITGSWWPLVFTAAMLGYEWLLYAWALQNPHNNRRSIADQ